jgi:hypothetical protein
VERTRKVQQTKWYPAQGRVSRFFDDVLVPGTTKVETNLIARLEPWELQTAVPFQQDYLAGFQAVRYDIEPEPGLESAKAQMAPVIESDCRSDTGGDEQRVHTVNTANYDPLIAQQSSRGDNWPTAPQHHGLRATSHFR